MNTAKTTKLNDPVAVRLSLSNPVRIGSGAVPTVTIGQGQPLALLCGPCVIESEEHALRHAAAIKQIAGKLGLGVVYKSSYDKANRTSSKSFRGLGMTQGLEVLARVRSELNIPVVTDVHTAEEAAAAGKVVDLLQIPAFLCRQTDLLNKAAETGKPVMVKKGQMVAPEDMYFAAEKIVKGGNNQVMLCERGACFGYRDLVVDFRSFAIMRKIGCPVVFDATHSVQIMGGAAGVSSGNREFIPALARAAVAVGVDAVFIESHEDPDNAPSDGPNMLPLGELESLLVSLKRYSELSRQESR